MIQWGCLAYWARPESEVAKRCDGTDMLPLPWAAATRDSAGDARSGPDSISFTLPMGTTLSGRRPSSVSSREVS